MLDKKTLLLAQLFITFMMAGLMSGIMSLFALGPTAEWLAAWPRQFALAWPIAFVLTLFTSRAGIGLAVKIMGRKPIVDK